MFYTPSRSRFILQLLLLAIFSSPLIPVIAEPQRAIYLDLNTLQLKPVETDNLIVDSPIRLGIKVEPPGTAGLVVDTDQSYMQLVTAMTEPFPLLDIHQKYVDHFGDRIDLAELKDYRPYMDNFPFIWEAHPAIKIMPNSHQSKLFFTSDDEASTQQDPSTQSPTFLFNIKADQFYEMNLVWFDGKANKFYQSALMINAFALHQRSQTNIPEQQFENILISLNREGIYTLWLINDQLEIQITGERSAKEIQIANWGKFATASLPKAQRNLSQNSYVTAMQNLTHLPYLDEMFHIKNQDGHGLPNIRYKVVRDDDRIYCGITNSRGETKRINTGQHPHHLKLYYGTSCAKL